MKYLELLVDSNYWGKVKRSPGYLRENYVDWLLTQSENLNISVVVGVRRSGKSTILQQVLYQLIHKRGVNPKNTLFVNLEDPKLVGMLSDNKLFDLIDEFKSLADLRSNLYIVFDEIQNVPDWELIVRAIHDKEKNIKIYVTGSSAKLLGRELGTKLTGRYLSTEVFPLSLVEFKNFRKAGAEEYIKEGGFPDVILSKDRRIREQLLKDYFESILLRDIVARYSIRDEFKLRRLSSQLFSNFANQASSYRLSKDLEVSSDTILQYFDYIEEAYLGFFVPKFSHSVRKQNYNPKKFYVIDNGLQSAVSFRVIDDTGKLFENAVFLSLRRKHKQIFYWQEGKEVDFVVKEKEQVKYLVNASVDIKMPETRERELSSLMQAMHELKKTESYLVIMKGKSEKIETEVGVVNVIGFEEFGELL